MRVSIRSHEVQYYKSFDLLCLVVQDSGLSEVEGFAMFCLSLVI